MRSVHLKVFENRCAKCGLEFFSLHLSRDYDLVIYTTQHGDMRFLDPDSDAVWPQVKILLDHSIGEWAKNTTERARIFHSLLARTIDPSDSGDIYYSPWETTPCSRCGGTERLHFNPVDPPRFQDVAIEEVTHNRWQKLSEEERRQEAELAVSRYATQQR